MLNTETAALNTKSAWQFTNRLDRVVMAIAGLFAGLAIFDLPQLPESITFTLEALVSISPFFLLSIGVAAYAKASGAEHLIAKVFSGNPVRMIVLAAIVGALSPFCSCGVIPLVAGLLVAGVPLAPVMAFWLSSPLMNPEMFIITAAALGLTFTIAKTIAAVGIGLLGGFLTHLVIRSGGFSNPLRAALASQCCKTSCGSKPAEPVINWKPWQEKNRISEFLSSAKENGWFLGRWLTLAFVIESLMVAYVPASLVAESLGSDAWWTIPLSVGAGIPAYLNGFAAVPLISGLMEMGMLPGAAMAFMIAGGVTSIPAALAVFALARKPLFAWYILLSLVGALITGLAYQSMVQVLG